MPEESEGGGSGLGGLVHEWKTAKPAEKVIIVAAVVGVAGIALYVYNKNKGSGGVTVNAPGQSGGAGASSGQTAGFPTIPQGSTPVLPAGVNPVYDANGNVVAYSTGGVTQPPAAPATSSTTQGTDTSGTTGAGVPLNVPMPTGTSGSVAPSTGIHGNIPLIKTAHTKIAKLQKTHVTRVRSHQHTTKPVPSGQTPNERFNAQRQRPAWVPPQRVAPVINPQSRT